MLVCLSDSWKIPVGYFLINGLSGIQKADLIKKCLSLVHESGVVVTSITFDGATSNFAMCKCLGADFNDIENLKTSFKHPITNEEVYIFLDPCHMLKLIRNCLGSQKVLTDGENNLIKWDYIELLVTHQDIEGLHAATKLRLRHLYLPGKKWRYA